MSTDPMPMIVRGDARALPLPDESVDLVVTSPPYFGLRSYTDDGAHYDRQLGAEATPEAFVDALLDCTREMVRVLKPTGSIWVNLGDKYATGAPGRLGATGSKTAYARSGYRDTSHAGRPKSLLLIPERYRIRCVDELGLIARAVVVWNKPNGLPESVTDRVRRSHEDWVHLTTQPRYYSAVDEIREAHTTVAPGQRSTGGAGYPAHMTAHMNGGAHALGKLPGSVWEIATQPLCAPENLGVDHFAAFPMEWPRRLVAGWSPREVCTRCGQGRRPLVERSPMRWRESPTAVGRHAPDTARRSASGTMLAAPSSRIVGSGCDCEDTTAPTTAGVVCDPFGGTGTTALVAAMHGRVGVSVDASADYCRLAGWRATDAKERARAMGLDADAVARVDRSDERQPSLLDLLEPGGAA